MKHEALPLKYLCWVGVISCFIGVVVGIRAFGILLTPVRVISVLALPFLLHNPVHKEKGIGRFATRLLIFMLIYGIASLSWSPDPALGFKNLTGLYIGVMIFLLVTRHAIDRSVLTKIMIIWAIMIIGNDLLGVYEIVTGEYLFPYVQDDDILIKLHELTSVGWLCPRIFWGNRNEFAFINAISALVLMGWAFEVRGVCRKLAFMATILAIIMVMFSYSRAAVFGLLIGLMVFAFILVIKTKAFLRIITILLMISLGVFLLYKGEEILYSSMMVSALVTKVETADNTDRNQNYTTAAIAGTIGSGGFGRGLGASTEIIGGGSYHHYLLEIFAELGLWYLLGYLILMAKVCIQLLSAIRQRRSVFWSGGLLASCIAFPLLCAGPSSILSVCPYWLWLAFVVAFTECDSIVMRLNHKQFQAGSIKCTSKTFPFKNVRKISFFRDQKLMANR
jgi:hypothetical protein